MALSDGLRVSTASIQASTRSMLRSSPSRIRLANAVPETVKISLILSLWICRFDGPCILAPRAQVLVIHMNVESNAFSLRAALSVLPAGSAQGMLQGLSLDIETIDDSGAFGASWREDDEKAPNDRGT